MDTTTPKCDMTSDCAEPVTNVDSSGYIYCDKHGIERRIWKRTRKLTAKELRDINEGKVLV